MTTPPIRTRPDGTKYPITPRKSKWPGQVLGAAALAIAIALGGTGVASTAGLTSARGSTSSASKAKARDRDARAVVQRLVRSGYRIESRLSSDDEDCAAHSYGQVHVFFSEHPCAALFRALFEVRDRRGGLALIAVAWVDMPDARSAQEFQELVDVHGTGNITELNRERPRYRYRNVRFTGEHYTSTRDGETVINAQAEPVGRTAAAAELAEFAVQAISDQ